MEVFGSPYENTAFYCENEQSWEDLDRRVLEFDFLFNREILRLVCK